MPDGADGKNENQNDVKNHLNGRFPDYNWQINNNCNYLANNDNPTSSRNNGRFIIHGINLLC